MAWQRARPGEATAIMLAGSEGGPVWSGVVLLPTTVTPALERAASQCASLSALADLLPFPLHGAAQDPARRPAIALLDRDGTIIEDRQYLADPAGVALLPGAGAALRQLQLAGIRLVVVTNQSGVGSGRISPVQLDAVTDRFCTSLGEEGVDLSGIYICPHRPDEGCACRKPATGLVTQAAQALGFDPAQAIMAGDKPADLLLARNLAIPGFLVLTGEGEETSSRYPGLADYVIDDLADLARICTNPLGLVVAIPLPRPY